MTEAILRKKPLKQYRFLTLLTMLFITQFLICDITAFRMVLFFGNEIPLSGLLIPVLFALGDILAEVYGYRITINILKSAIVCQMLFGIIITLALTAPSPPNNIVNQHYNFAFEHILRTNITSIFSVTSGMSVNALLFSKFKIYTNGKKFWFRTLISSGLSEIVLCTVAYLILFSGLRSISNIISIIFSVWLYKMIVSVLINPIVLIIGRLIKNFENSDVYDNGISYNLFEKTKDYIVEYDDQSFEKKLQEELIENNINKKNNFTQNKRVKLVLVKNDV